ncbi:MAG: hypothetical protein AAFV98_16740 [Chloroflexota bacterium]
MPAKNTRLSKTRFATHWMLLSLFPLGYNLSVFFLYQDFDGSWVNLCGRVLYYGSDFALLFLLLTAFAEQRLIKAYHGIDAKGWILTAFLNPAPLFQSLAQWAILRTRFSSAWLWFLTGITIIIIGWILTFTHCGNLELSLIFVEDSIMLTQGGGYYHFEGFNYAPYASGIIPQILFYVGVQLIRLILILTIKPVNQTKPRKTHIIERIFFSILMPIPVMIANYATVILFSFSFLLGVSVPRNDALYTTLIAILWGFVFIVPCVIAFWFSKKWTLRSIFLMWVLAYLAHIAYWIPLVYLLNRFY